MPTYKGVGTIFGVAGAPDSGVPGTAYLTAQSANTNHNVESVVLRNQVGVVSGVVVYDDNETFEMVWVPKAATLANAKTAMNLPDPGAKVVISGCDVAEMDGNYIYLGPGQRQFTNEGIAQFTLTLTRYSTDLTATIST